MTDPAFNWARGQQPGLETATVNTLRAEASHRSFYRLSPSDGESVVLMISPPDKEQNEQFERLAEVFGNARVPVPAILAADRARGWYLLTDLGSHELADAYGSAAEDAAIEAALTNLIRLQQIEDPAVPPYTQARFADELEIFTEWFARRLLSTELPQNITPVFHHLVAQMPGQLQVCVHRDYHCRNLLFDPATHRLGVVDFQDALRGPVSYDLASLLHDCYHTFSDQQIVDWQSWYLAHSPLPLNPEVFTADMTLTAIQRQLKAVGIFVRLRLRDGKTTHLEHVLPVLDSLSKLAAPLPELAPLSDWLAGLDRPAIARQIDGLNSTVTKK